MDNFLNILKSRFGLNEAILLKEILQCFPDVAENTTYRRMKKALEEKTLIKAKKGVYYIPTTTRFGLSTLSDATVIRKKYVADEDGVFGYYAGLMLENRLGVSNQIPGKLEIVTNKETNRSRRIQGFGGYKEIVLRKPRVPVNTDNVEALEFLDLITNTSISELDSNELASLKKCAKKITRSKLVKYTQYYPQKTAQKLIESEAAGVFT
ncbi:MAG: hypothetical protein RSC05_15125 [Acinetobacter sp.]